MPTLSRVATAAISALLVAAVLAPVSCSAPPAKEARAVPSPPVVATKAAPVDASAPVDVADAEATDAEAADAGPQPVAYPGRSEGCPDGMLRVDGEYCIAPLQICKEHLRDVPPPGGAERCARYQEPSVCVVPKRRHMAFCMDRFEYPNKVGELPRTLVNYADAVNLCKAEGKRLCTVEEFNFACEGPEALPYAYGYVRDATKCNIDKPYILPDHSWRMDRYDDCLKNPKCAEELKRLDQRLHIGESLSCVSWSGVYDLNGNANEWVRRTDKWKYPDRGGLKGGWWGPVRDRCRPTHTTHNEEYWGYEVGLRCCKNVDDTKVEPPKATDAGR